MPFKIEKPLVDARSEAIQKIKDKAREVILARLPLWKQNNLTARGLELTHKGTLTEAEQIEINSIQATWDWVKAVRNASNVAEVDIGNAVNFVKIRNIVLTFESTDFNIL